jgi:hypothetical protein
MASYSLEEKLAMLKVERPNAEQLQMLVTGMEALVWGAWDGAHGRPGAGRAGALMRVAKYVLPLALALSANALADASIANASHKVATVQNPEGCRPEDMKAWAKPYYEGPNDNEVLGFCEVSGHRG